MSGVYSQQITAQYNNGVQQIMLVPTFVKEKQEE